MLWFKGSARIWLASTVACAKAVAVAFTLGVPATCVAIPGRVGWLECMRVYQKAPAEATITNKTRVAVAISCHGLRSFLATSICSLGVWGTTGSSPVIYWPG